MLGHKLAMELTRLLGAGLVQRNLFLHYLYQVNGLSGPELLELDFLLSTTF
jgi:hypothetical protein